MPRPCCLTQRQVVEHVSSDGEGVARYVITANFSSCFEKNGKKGRKRRKKIERGVRLHQWRASFYDIWCRELDNWSQRPATPVVRHEHVNSTRQHFKHAPPDKNTCHLCRLCITEFTVSISRTSDFSDKNDQQWQRWCISSYWSRVSVCHCLCVCLSLTTLPLHGPGCNLEEWYEVPSSCAILGGFAISRRFCC